MKNAKNLLRVSNNLKSTVTVVARYGSPVNRWRWVYK
jgi:hypothetical protein